MSSLVEDDLTRASTFFAVAFLATGLGGIALGDPRLGLELGFGMGVAAGVFAYFFLVPTAGDADREASSSEDPPPE